MLPRERVFAALEHREPDRVPWGEHAIDYNVYEDILGRETLVRSKMRETRAMWEGRRDEVVAAYKRDMLDLVRALEMDIVTVYGMPRAGYHPEPMEQLDDDTFRDKNGDIYHVSSTTHDLMPYSRNTEGYKPPTLADLEAELERIDDEPLGDPNDSCWELVRHAVAEMKGTHFVMMCIGDVSFPGFGATEEEQWMSLVEHPEICRKIAEIHGRRLVREIALYAALGLDGVMPCGDLGSSTGLLASPRIYRDMVLPWHKAHVEAAHKHGLKVLKHCCGHTWPIVDDLADTYDAYEGIQASAGMDIKRLKEQVRGRLCLWGGIWHEHIIMHDVADIEADAAYSFEHAAPGGGYIMGSTHSLAVGAKRENVLAMKRCRDEWGVYPIDPKRFK
jgi:uroporphyrinogen decarboxylase